MFKFTSAQGAAMDIGKKKETGEYSGFPNRQTSVSLGASCRRSWLTSRMKQCKKRQAQWKAENMLGKKEPSPAA